MRPDVYHLLPICHVSLHIKVRITFLTPECCLSDFTETSLHFIVYLQTLQNMTHTTVTVISQTKHYLSYTGCHRRNGPNFGRVFLMLNYTDITQNTYIQS